MSSDDDEKIRPYNPDDSDDDDEKIKNKSDSDEEKEKEKEKVDIKNDTYCIFIKEVTGKTTQINCSPSNTIAQIKNFVYEKLQIKQNAQRLMYNVKQLEDDRTLEDYEIPKGGTIHLILRLHGGKISLI